MYRHGIRVKGTCHKLAVHIVISLLCSAHCSRSAAYHEHTTTTTAACRRHKQNKTPRERLRPQLKYKHLTLPMIDTTCVGQQQTGSKNKCKDHPRIGHRPRKKDMHANHDMKSKTTAAGCCRHIVGCHLAKKRIRSTECRLPEVKK